MAGTESTYQRVSSFHGTKTKCSLLYLVAGTNPRLARSCVGVEQYLAGEIKVAGRPYLMRQAEVLFKLAKSTSDPKVAAALIEKAADLKSQVDDSTLPDPTALAPDVQRLKARE
jgi:hypothetical protein